MKDREISPEGVEFQPGTRLSPWLNSNPEGEIHLSYMDWLMLVYFSPTFSEL